MFQLIRLPAVKDKTGLSRSTIYLRIEQGFFTKPVALGPRCVGWPAGDVDAINAARIAGKSDTEIKALVSRLHASRADAG